MKKQILFLGLYLSLFSYSAFSAHSTNHSTITAEGFSLDEALQQARALIPDGFIENSEWTSPLIDCEKGREKGFFFKEETDQTQSQFCENELGQRSLVQVTLAIRKAL